MTKYERDKLSEKVLVAQALLTDAKALVVTFKNPDAAIRQLEAVEEECRRMRDMITIIFAPRAV